MDAATSGLTPAPDGSRALIRILDPYRCLLAGGRAHRAGRFRVGRFCTVLLLGATLDLDLRADLGEWGALSVNMADFAPHLPMQTPRAEI